MATQQSKPQSIFPDLPRQSPAIDDDGNFTPLWDLGLSALFQALQNNYKNEGIIIPPLMASQMATIQSLYSVYIGNTYNSLTMNLPDISGQTAYDTSTQITNQFVIAQNGGIVTLAQWVPLAVMLTYPGNPDMNVAGVLNWLCYDTTDKSLYVCYTAGAIGTARWASV